MAAVNFFDNFETLWAQAGALEVIDENQYKAGWAYIGATPPSVEQFNKVQQLSDQKAAWLFAQIKELAEQGGFALTASMVDALTRGIAASMQAGSAIIGVDTGAANTYAVDYTPAIAEVKDGMPLWFKVKTANTGASTLNVNGLGARPIIGMGHSPLQGGEMAANGKALVVWKDESNSWVLVGCSGGAQQVAAATRSAQAVQFGQVSGVVGSARNLTGSASVGGTTANFTASELVCESGLGGLRYCLASFNATLNLASVGVNGMDTGQAPASGAVAIYAIYNPSTGASGLLGQTMPGVAPETYGGGNMPAGFTASALISVVSTNPSRQFVGFVQRDRFIGIAGVGVLGTTVSGGNAFNAHSIGGAVPANAKTYSGYATANATGASAVNIAVAANAAGMANQTANMSGSSNGGPITWKDVPLTTPQTAYFYYNAPGATAQNYGFYISGYTI